MTALFRQQQAQAIVLWYFNTTLALDVFFRLSSQAIPLWSGLLDIDTLLTSEEAAAPSLNCRDHQKEDTLLNHEKATSVPSPHCHRRPFSSVNTCCTQAPPAWIIGKRHPCSSLGGGGERQGRKRWVHARSGDEHPEDEHVICLPRLLPAT